MIDMFVDFDQSVIIYKNVSNDDNNNNQINNENKEYKMNGFDRNIKYTIHFYWFEANTEIQCAKIDVNMFGKNAKLVKWPCVYVTVRAKDENRKNDFTFNPFAII